MVLSEEVCQYDVLNILASSCLVEGKVERTACAGHVHAHGVTAANPFTMYIYCLYLILFYYTFILISNCIVNF